MLIFLSNERETILCAINMMKMSMIKVSMNFHHRDFTQKAIDALNKRGFFMSMRSIYCGNVNLTNKDSEITLCGWVNRRRDLGGLIFIDLRDRTGIVQVVFEPDNESVHALASTLRNEYCICVKGTVKARPDDQINKKMATGEIEVYAKELKIFNKAGVLPLDFNQENSEELRLRYRYLDLRRPEMVEKLVTRAKITHFVRHFLDENGFLDIETPMLTKATPEGARDYLVPSRIHHGKFYALPQSPQLFKQLLMIAGYDRYYQIVKCFRDEDLRADRQPEFTQIDVETSFMTSQDVRDIMEEMMRELEERNIGLQIINITVQDSEPPTDEIIAAFKSVETAKQGADTAKNNALQYQNKELPNATAEADRIRKDAEAEKATRIAEAEGQVARLNKIYEQYKLYPLITKKRMFYETMEEILPSMKIIITDGQTQEVYPLESFADINSTTTNNYNNDKEDDSGVETSTEEDY